MDPDRDELPDIDLDICQEGRARILEYVRGKYGHVAQIITFGTLKAKAVVKDVARVVGLGFDEANQLTKLIPSELHITLDKALAQEPELKKRYQSDERSARLSTSVGDWKASLATPGFTPPASSSPISRWSISFRCIGRRARMRWSRSTTGRPSSRVGLLKMDFLGLRTLTTLERARRLAEARTGTPIDLEKIDLADQRVYEMFARGETRGSFSSNPAGCATS